MCPKKVLMFEKSPKFDYHPDYHTFSKIFFLISFVNGPKIFGDHKVLFSVLKELLLTVILFGAKVDFRAI